MRALTSVYSVLVEAWSEFRVYRARVLMAIVGVAVAIMALTSIAAISAVAQQGVVEGLERGQGRPAMMNISLPYSEDGRPLTTDEEFGHLVTDTLARYQVSYSTRQGYAQPVVRGLPPDANLSGQLVDPDYAVMFRTRMVAGSWFSARDADRLVPAVVINEGLWRLLGSPDVASHPMLHLISPTSVDAVVVGVAAGGDEHLAQLWMLYDAYRALQPPGAAEGDAGSTQYFAWVPPEVAGPLSERLSADLSRAVGNGATVSVNRQDYQAADGPDPLLFLKIVGGAGAGLILLLGALGLLNISMVTVRARIREIGIRRSFGATAGRVFAGVMMESVVATAVAGVAGVMVAILALENPVVIGFLHRQGLQDVPAFPLSAAAFGMLIAVGVGALAGLLPSIVAVRVRPIDAIRY
ncbi:putative ABC transport system permease protein [Leifsonia sp. 98AMF]|uniref:ABC transporter permease n=1 Tax=unclassified Leifsonia TaxID=2663824 RepID=UPI00087D7546|nr:MULTISPECIES: ABC transporter permease [unclassified Leifsonia]SDH73207.1 putative ABC transport system permease protein [Leifsonia sp. 197AMF]SDJ48822.1 putative ABC transport system permease protein [Leifsonia sp. 466MF]SDK25993.1 putative ABC transport system permease protein [Leifsonia sp. 157MF]SDN68678.1 putative ABC transport system permease protein [Leifsonia sp. 509MF]SEN39558.1 putative ABC transport system permease protein [Leifsonia sp. 467MF]